MDNKPFLSWYGDIRRHCVQAKLRQYYCAVLCCAMLYCAVLCCAVLCCAVLCCAVHGLLQCVILYCVNGPQTLQSAFGSNGEPKFVRWLNTNGIAYSFWSGWCF